MKQRISMDDDNPTHSPFVCDLIGNILKYMEKPGDIANYIAKQIRELVGAQIVAIMELSPDKKETDSRLIDICPPSKREIWESNEVKEYVRATLEFTEPRFVDPTGNKEGRALSALNLGNAFVIPLAVGNQKFGAIHIMGLKDVNEASPLLTSLAKASSLFALILKSTHLYHDLELKVQNRTRELEEREQLFRALFEQASDGIFILDSNGKVLSVNDSFARMLGRTTREIMELGIQGLDVEGVTPMPDRIARVLAGQTLTFEVEVFHKDGHLVPLEVTSNPILIGGKTRILATHKDITERREAARKQAAFNAQLEEKVRVRTTELENANRELKSFAYSVSHDLRSPLRSIHGFTQIFLDAYGALTPPEGLEHLQRVLQATRKMGNLIDDMLSLSRVSMGELHQQTIDITSLSQDLCRELMQDLTTRKFDLHIQQGMAAKGDPALVRIALHNLIGNAIKFTSKKEETRIEIGSIETSSAMTEFYIRDNGAGFDPVFAADLFVPFHRLHTIDEFPGNGIGLATVQRVVHRHGGDLKAEGIPDGGATFRFSLPRAGN